MMYRYYIVFSYQGVLACGTSVTAHTDGEALLDAEFKLICWFPNVPYDGMDIVRKEPVVE